MASEHASVSTGDVPTDGVTASSTSTDESKSSDPSRASEITHAWLKRVLNAYWGRVKSFDVKPVGEVAGFASDMVRVKVVLEEADRPDSATSSGAKTPTTEVDLFTKVRYARCPGGTVYAVLFLCCDSCMNVCSLHMVTMTSEKNVRCSGDDLGSWTSRRPPCLVQRCRCPFNKKYSFTPRSQTRCLLWSSYLGVCMLHRR